MRRMLIFIVLITCFAGSGNAESRCNYGQHATAKLPRIKNGIVKATSCENPGGDGGTIRIEITVDGKQRFSTMTTYAPSAYVLRLDTAIEFDNDASQGLGVATAAGRDATGMHYWRISDQGKTVINLGSAPSLVRDRFIKNTFSTLISSSGEYQSIRYYYTIKGDKLTPDRAIDFNSLDSSNYEATLMDALDSGNMQITARKKISAEQATLCMAGMAMCF
ncbi:conserved exported protein of unknown function [Burkholderia multivorans]